MKIELNGKIPVLSYKEIDARASLLLNQLDPTIIANGDITPLELIVEKFLQFDLDYQYLSNNQYYLGRTVFTKGTEVIVTNKKFNEIDIISVNHPTIFIEQSLLDTDDLRYPFTLAHELGHAVLHKPLFYENEDQLTLFDVSKFGKNSSYKPLTRLDLIEAGHRDIDNKNVTELDWIEWQANVFAACILIPKKSLLTFYQKYEKDYRFLINDVANKFSTSYSVAEIRIKNLQLL